MGRNWEERVAEYRNSPKLAYRLKADKWASAWVFGTMGTYRTRVNLQEAEKSSCTCPFEGFPCKHIAAVAATYRDHPRTFKDFDKVLGVLRKKRSTELVHVIRRIVEKHPSALEELGVKGPRRLAKEEPWQ